MSRMIRQVMFAIQEGGLHKMCYISQYVYITVPNAQKARITLPEQFPSWFHSSVISSSWEGCLYCLLLPLPITPL